jgi:rod shape-determining protein MreC
MQKGCRVTSYPCSRQVNDFSPFMSRTNIIALLIVLVMCFGLINMDSSLARQMQVGLLQALTPLLANSSDTQQTLADWTEGIETLEDLEQENAYLRDLNGQLQIENQMLADLKEENDRLRAMLSYIERSLFDLVPAEVVARDARSFVQYLTVGRGRDSGILPNMPVLAPEGVLGKTVNVLDDHTQVLLITDPSCKVSARVEGTRVLGVVSGSRDAAAGEENLLKLEFVSREADIQPGMKVQTSGLGGVYPPGIPIGTVRSFKVNPMNGEALIEPAVQVPGIQNTFIVRGIKKE